MAKKYKVVMVRVPEELHQAVRLKSLEEGRYVSEVVRELLTKWVAEEHKPNEKRT